MDLLRDSEIPNKNHKNLFRQKSAGGQENCEIKKKKRKDALESLEGKCEKHIVFLNWHGAEMAGNPMN